MKILPLDYFFSNFIFSSDNKTKYHDLFCLQTKSYFWTTSNFIHRFVIRWRMGNYAIICSPVAASFFHKWMVPFYDPSAVWRKMALKRPLRHQNISIRTNSLVNKYLVVKISFGFSIFWANSFFVDSFGILFTLKKGTFSKSHKKCLSHRKKVPIFLWKAHVCVN